jgi:recombination protein RecT
MADNRDNKNNPPALSDPVKFAGWLTKNSEKMQKELPEGYKLEQVKRLALHLMQNDDELSKCTMDSLYLCILKAAHLDLAIDLKEAHIVRYGTKAELQVDYKGLIKMSMRSGRVIHVKAEVVRQGDYIAYKRGTERADRWLVHEPLPFNDGKVIGAYAMFDMSDGYTEFEVLNASDAAAIRAKAKPGSMLWNEFAGEAWKKAVIRRGIKTLELLPEDKRAMVEDDSTHFDMGQATATTVADLNQRFAPRRQLQGQAGQGKQLEHQQEAANEPAMSADGTDEPVV